MSYLPAPGTKRRSSLLALPSRDLEAPLRSVHFLSEVRRVRAHFHRAIATSHCHDEDVSAVYIRTYIYTYMHMTALHTYMQAYMYTYVHTYMHAYTCAQTHTHYVHIFVPAWRAYPRDAWSARRKAQRKNAIPEGFIHRRCCHRSPGK